MFLVPFLTSYGHFWPTIQDRCAGVTINLHLHSRRWTNQTLGKWGSHLGMHSLFSDCIVSGLILRITVRNTFVYGFVHWRYEPPESFLSHVQETSRQIWLSIFSPPVGKAVTVTFQTLLLCRKNMITGLHRNSSCCDLLFSYVAALSLQFLL